jgi:hypothetical protein
MKKLVLASLIAASVSMVEAGVIRHDRADGDYLGLATQSQFDPVGSLLYSTSGGNWICSGTLIESSYVLTAAHCLDDATTSNVTFSVGGSTYFGSEWTVHDSWFGDLFAGFDIAVLELTSSVDNVSAATRYTGSSEVGQVGTHVGFGATGTGLDGATLPPGIKRAGQNEMDEVDSSFITGEQHSNIIWNDFDAPAGTNPLDGSGLVDDSGFLENPFAAFGFDSGSALELEYSIAGGDSGGGYFLEEGGDWFLAGVHSFGAAFDGNPNGSYGDLSGSTRVSSFNSWIDSAIASLGGGSPVPVSEPSTIVLLSLGLAFLGFRRRNA